ncbi:MAG: YfcE family phosphodiesterase [Patescibacteria group bacterium]|jgi:putative phosphoesterase|nr:YfcE family phosphodiesterase [Patescibacteria group bacterium]MDD3778009.1 YfcE family phosphodiesterase [Patescibacteria group bacterium]MDD3939154.1 YfcE family phosphodiesterase [Patescibacteria group bacterium]MDD4443677.1 YfcE family phosphodiesterase [Patescibacteria group bacterium]NCU39645.1 YfcE family phosphodiesterase [Candidatus Falkowbacteria bacterium]
MKIAIISDSHDNLDNLKICFSIIKKEKIKKIICCGDVCSLDTLKFISTNFLGEIFLVTGNAETYQEKDLKKIKNITYQGLLGYIKINNLNIGFCHKPTELKELQLKAKTKLDFIFYGHTHKPWLEKKLNTFLANPGNVAGIFYQPTFALLNTINKKLELKLIVKACNK